MAQNHRQPGVGQIVVVAAESVRLRTLALDRDRDHSAEYIEPGFSAVAVDVFHFRGR